MRQVMIKIKRGCFRSTPYLNQSKDHKNKHSTEQEGTKKVEVMASLCGPKRIESQADDNHSRQYDRFQNNLPYFQSLTNIRITGRFFMHH